MHPCPCCGYRTLPGRGDYDLCPVCWWEDEGTEPWEVSGPNGTTLVEAQQEFLSDDRPYRRRPGKARPPRRREARDPDWRPIEVTDELMARVQRTWEQHERRWEAERRRVARESAADPEGPFKGYNAGMRSLRAEAAALPHREVKARVRALAQEHDVAFPEAYLELEARLAKDADYYRRHRAHAAWWVLRHGRPGTYGRRWREVRSGSFSFAG